MSEELTDVAEQQGTLWSAAGKDWTELSAPTATPVWDKCLDLARVTRGKTVLDIGCGSGGALGLAQFRGADVAGIDAATELLEIARDRLNDPDLRHADMVDLPFENDAFDAVLAINSLMYTNSQGQALQEAHRVLNPDGRLAIAVWAEKDKCEFRHIMGALQEVLPEPPSGEGPFTLSPPGVLEELLEEHGFEPVETVEVATPFVYMDQDHYLGAILGSGPGQGVLQQVDEETAKDALLTAGEQFRQEDGAYRIENAFRAVAAKPAK